MTNTPPLPSIPDNRLQLPAPKIDFTDDVGTTGQDHDDYPPPQGQARFDHLRMYLISLLANQSSYDPPTQYRDGTVWFDLKDSTLKIRSNNVWAQISDAISVQQFGGLSNLSLTQFANQVLQILPTITPDIVYNGVCTNNHVSIIPIPAELRASVGSQSRSFVYINGMLLDPRNTALQPGVDPSQIVLIDRQMSIGDTFTVNIRYVPTATFYLPTVAAS
jgi:hypothetical protein